MGDYTRKSENYARQDRKQNTASTQSSPPKIPTVLHTCWRCNRSFELPAPTRPDTVKCPYCEMVHGLITSK